MKTSYLVFISIMSLFLLAACSSSTSEIATIRGGKVTIEDFYRQAFQDPSFGGQSATGVQKKQMNENLLREMILQKVFTDRYGEDVSDDLVEKSYQKQAEAYGGEDQFEKVLEASGFTKKSFKEKIKEYLAIEVGLKEHMKIGQEELRQAWETFHPTVEA